MGVEDVKQIKRAADLAINGAEPAFGKPLHVGRPNIGGREKFMDLVGGILDRAWLTNNGPLVRQLEERIASMHEVEQCVAMCNGTIALEIAIRALGLSGEVIVPSFTFVATAHALSWQGISPVFADIDPQTHQLDPDAVRAVITPRTQGIIGVHLWGCPAPFQALQELADEYELSLLFDAAHAFGCRYGRSMVGGFGRCEVFSFHATKCFNTFEGGAVLTNDSALAERMRLMRNFGFAGYDQVIHPGTNGKMSEVCAAMGLANLEAFPRLVEENRQTYECYRRELKGIRGVRLVPVGKCEQGNFQYVVIEIMEDARAGRDAVVEALHAENVLARRYFWPGCHRMSPYNEQQPQAGVSLPHTEQVAGRVVVLPAGPSMSPEAIRTIAGLIGLLCDG